MATAKPLTPRPKRHVVKLAEIAFRELSLPGSLHSKADEARLWRLMRGLEWLDEELGRVRGSLMGLLEAFDRDKNVDQLVEGARKLSEIPDPEKKADYEKNVRKLTFEEAVDEITTHINDIQGFDEEKVENILEVMTDKPIVITTPNPRRKRDPIAQFLAEVGEVPPRRLRR